MTDKNNDQKSELLEIINKHDGSDLISLYIRSSESPVEELVYLPARVVKSLIRECTIHPSKQFIISVKARDPTRKLGYREDLTVFTRERLREAKVDIDKLINNDKIYIEQQMVKIKNYSRFGDKVAELYELQEFDRQLSVIT